MKKSLKEFEDYKNWCKENGRKPSHAESLRIYVGGLKSGLVKNKTAAT